jgi:hypothetical protein
VQFAAAYTAANAEATSYFAAWTTQPHQGYIVAVDNLITALKAAGYYSTTKDFVIHCGPNAEDSKRLFKNPSTKVTISGTETFEAFRGFTGLVSPASYIDTGINQNAASPFVRDSAHELVWTTNDIKSDSPAAGSSGSSHHIAPRTSSDTFSSWNNDFADLNAANTNGKGIYIGNRSGSGARQEFKDGVLVASDTQASSGLGSANFLICSTNAFPDEHQVAMWAAGSSVGATNTIPAAVTAAIRAFADTIGAPY